MCPSCWIVDSGECCCAGTRTFVHEKIYDEFVEKSVALTKNRKCGDPFDESVTQGAQIDERSQQKILRYVESANKQGAKLETGGKRFGNAGFYVEPTIFSNVTDNMTIAQEEVGHLVHIFAGRQKPMRSLTPNRSSGRFNPFSNSKHWMRPSSGPTTHRMAWRLVS